MQATPALIMKLGYVCMDYAKFGLGFVQLPNTINIEPV